MESQYLNVEIRKLHKLVGNRDVTSENHVRDLMESISKNGYDGAPIVINEKYEIIEGQHRIEAMKRLGIEKVPARIVYGANLETVRRLNNIHKKWTVNDFVDSNAELGDIPAKYVRELSRAYPKVQLSYVLSAITCTYGGVNTRRLKNKTLKCDEADYMKAFKFLAEWSSICDLFEGTARSIHAAALRLLMEIDEDVFYELCKRMKAYPRRIPSRLTVRDTFEVYDEIFNYHRKQKKSLLAMYLQKDENKESTKEKTK